MPKYVLSVVALILAFGSSGAAMTGIGQEVGLPRTGKPSPPVGAYAQLQEAAQPAVWAGPVMDPYG
jgi:hypothetical protein